jgi:two-component system phosphate regulon sensor histidine kinase PhoR
MPGLRSAKALYANTYVAEGDFFSVSFDYLADYNHKAKIVLRNMLGILLVIVASVLAVMGIFFYTLWNLVKQKKVSEMQSEFINHITHELKTPLTTIAVAAESISSDSILNQPERIVSLSAIIAKQNRYLSHLINNVLDISFWGKDVILSRGVKTDLEQFIHEFLAAYRITIKEQDVIIKESVDLERKQARIDPAQMMTALNNLLDNAVKFSEKPVIRFESNVKEGNWCVCITDNGCGIEKDDLDKIFNRFYRGNQSRDRKIKGLGLGLYNVKRIVEAHEGILELESEFGQGTTVTITIPFLQDHENTAG